MLPTPHLAPSACSRLLCDLLSKAQKSQDRELFLRNDLARLFRKDTVNALLQCCCPDCKYWRDKANAPRESYETYSEQIVGESTSWLSRQQRRYVIILSLLVYVRRIPLIFKFLRKKHSDDFLQGNLGKLSPKILQTDILPKNLDDKSLDVTARLIDEHKNKFFIPNVDSSYGNFAKEVIFPFLHETKIGSGGYGTVYSFQIPKDYIKFEDPSHTGQFAKKVFMLSNNIGKRGFEREFENLQEVMKIGGPCAHPHLIRYHKVFRHGDFGIIIFPRAESNLRTVLESPNTIYSKFLTEGIRDHPFWDQLLGISEALENLHTFNVPESERGGCLYGYHFDLKPANILVGFDRRFIISDFGQAHFLRPRNGVYVENSVARGLGGDTSYAPPENEDRHLVDNQHLENTRKYDIWGLGCIFLEVIWFIMKGSQGVEELYDLRIKREDGTDDRFYYLDKKQNAHLKDDLWHKTRELRTKALLGADREFVEKMVELTFKMLMTNRNERYAADQVVENLRYILELRNASLVKMDSDDPATESRSRESRNNDSQPSLFISGQFKVNGQSHRGELRVKKHGRNLNVSFPQNQKSDVVEMGQASDLQLLPFYALHHPPHPRQHRFSDSDLVLLPISGYPSKNRFAAHFKPSSPQERLDLQGKLLGQHIMIHKDLISASFQIREKKGKKSSVESDSPEQAGAVQIWCLDKGLKPHESQQHYYGEPIPRHLVIYMYKSVYLIRFDSTFRVCKETEGTRILEWKPKEPSCHYFDGLLLNCPLRQEGPGIPMDTESIEQNKIKLELIRLTFETPKDSASFRQGYKSEKERWSNQQKFYQSHRREIAQRNGFDRN